MEWKPIAEGAPVWTADYRLPGLPCRSWAVRLQGGGCAVGSPGATLVESFSQELGDPARILVAPNSYHWMGIPGWRERFPEAGVAAAPGAVRRLQRKGLRPTVTLDDVEARLPEGAALLEVPATRIGELWLRAPTAEGTAWLIGDAFFNIDRVSRRLRLRLMTRVLKSGPGLAISNLMKWGGVRNRRAYREWILARLAEDRPTILVPAHGAILRGPDVADRLGELVRRRL